MVKGFSFERIRRAVLAAGSIALAMLAAGTLQTVAAERAPGRGGQQGSPAEAITLTERGVELVADRKFEEALEAFGRAIEAAET